MGFSSYDLEISVRNLKQNVRFERALIRLNEGEIRRVSVVYG